MKMNEHARAWCHDYVATLLAQSALPPERRSSIHWEILNHLHEASERIAAARGATEISLADAQQAVKEAGGFAGINASFLQTRVTEMPRATLGIRAVAFLIDAAVLLTGLVFLEVWVSDVFHDALAALLDLDCYYWGCPGFGGDLLFLLWTAVEMSLAFLYFFTTEYRLGGTLGKLALRLRTVQADGSQLTSRSAAIRNVSKVIPPLFLVDAIVYLVAFRDEEQRPSDRIANTIVVNTAQRSPFRRRSYSTPATSLSTTEPPPTGPPIGPPGPRI